MFETARIKLTAWYLLIIMLISLFFSLIIYLRVAEDLKRGFNRAEMLLRAEELGIRLPPRINQPFVDQYPELRQITPRFLLVENLNLAKERMIRSLVLINGFILFFSAGAGYFLAGKTLKPIKLAMEEQERFTADASHELRTPLTSLKTAIEVGLRDKNLNLSKARDLLSESLTEVDALSSLTGSLLSLAKIQQNGMAIKSEGIDLARIVERAIKKIDPVAKKKKIGLVVQIPQILLLADKQKIEEVLVIFLDNAVKYTPKGGKVSVTGYQEKKRVIIKIEDNGVGIAKEHLLHIFDRFYRVDESRSDSKKDGFGLGLALAKQIVEMHRGKILVKSQVNKGSVFSIVLPL